MYRKKPDVDVINDVILLAIDHYPDNAFMKGLYRQYHDLGGLSRKQMEGLLGKVERVPAATDAQKATLAAEIRKKPQRFKSEAPTHSPIYEKDESAARLIREILERYPEHRMVKVLQLKIEKMEPLTATERQELERFHRLLVKPSSD
jgi:hypothetical protein